MSISVRELSEQECMALLRHNRVGRLACSRDGRPYVVPIYYAPAERSLYCFSLPGKKIEWMQANRQVAMLVEEQGAGRGWKSVLAEGRYEELRDSIGHKRERERAFGLISKHADWWDPGGRKPATSPSYDLSVLFFRIAIEAVSGREARED